MKRKAKMWYPQGGEKPTTCGTCRDHYLNNPLLQAEVRHEWAKFGERAAENLLNEKLEPFHEDH